MPLPFQNILSNLPEVAPPTQKKLSFKEKLKWTGIILILFFVMGLVPLFGLGANSLQRFEFLSIILGAKFGSILSLGIGPIVTASIVLQLLNGSGLLKFDLTTHEGKKEFQGVQKAMSLFFIIFESAIYVGMGGLAPSADIAASLGVSTGVIGLLLMFQLFLGGILVLFMDEVVSKWGFYSGISLFIAAGVSEGIVIRLLSPFTSSGALYLTTNEAPVGALFSILYFLPQGNPQEVFVNFAAIFATALVFVMAVYAQAMKIEIPLSFGRIRGHGIRWPLAFIYTSNIPVILVAALIANIQLWAKLMANSGLPLLGNYVGSSPASGLILWLTPNNILGNLVKGNLALPQVFHSLFYIMFMAIGSVIFSIFWVQTSGMDAKSQAKQIVNSGLQIPGFRRDERILERLLGRYITPLTVMGALTVGFLAAIADLSGALSNGTGILLTVMIIYKLYEDIAHQHMMDMHPLLRNFMQK